MKKFKCENQILILLAFFSISIGLWENFRQLWLQDNGFSAMQISNITSIGTLLSVIGIILVGKYITLGRLKGFMTITLGLKTFNLIILHYLNKTGLTTIINALIVIDIATGYLIITSIYPLITTIVKNNTIYSKRKLTEYLFKDIGVLLGGLIIGKQVLGVFVNYNTCLLISIIFLLFAVLIIANITTNYAVEKTQNKKKVPILKYVLKRKILILYSLYTFIGTIAYSTVLGLKMLTFTNYFGFTDSGATNYFLIIGLIADFIGIIALKYFTPKNDYITITIKFVIRFLAYAVAFFANNVIICIIAITWSLLISTAYENICDGYYINSVENEYQLSFANFRYIVKYIAEAIGILFCGLMYEVGLRYMFGLSALLMIFQIILSYRLIWVRKYEKT